MEQFYCTESEIVHSYLSLSTLNRIPTVYSAIGQRSSAIVNIYRLPQKQKPPGVTGGK